MGPEEIRNLSVDMPSWEEGPRVDDFLVAVSKLKSGAVYLIAGAGGHTYPRSRPRMKRHHLRVCRVDLATMLRRDPDQRIYCMAWYPRKRTRPQ